MVPNKLVLLAFACLVGTSASAQAPPEEQRPGKIPKSQKISLGPGIRLAGKSVHSLLSKSAIRDELKLTEAQNDAIKKARSQGADAVKEAAREPRARLEAYRKLHEAQGLKPDPEVLAALSEHVNQSEKEGQARSDALVLAVLDRSQRTRFEQIRLQLDGPMAFARAEVQRRLNLDPATIEQIEIVLAEAVDNEQLLLDAAQQAFSSVRRDVAKPAAKPYTIDDATKKARTTAQNARAATMRKIGRLLTKRQRYSFNKALGEPFDSAVLRDPKSQVASK